MVLIYCRRSTQILGTVSIRMFITQRRHIDYFVKEKDEERGTKYWVHPYFNRSGKLGHFITAREPDQSSESYGLFYTIKGGRIVLNFAPSWTTRMLPVIQMECFPGRPTSLIVASSLAFINQQSTLIAREVSAFCGDMFTSERQTLKQF